MKGLKTEGLRIAKPGLKRGLLAMVCFFSALLLSGVLEGAVRVEAAVKKTAILLNGSKASCEVDLDGDGKKEEVVLKTVSDEQGAYFSKVRFYVNGNLALSYGSMGINMVTADYVDMNGKEIFFRVLTNTDNDCVVTDRMYRYDPDKKKFMESVKLLDDLCGILHAQPEITGVTDSSLKVAYRMQFDEIGRVEWTGSYRAEEGRLVLESDTMKVKSTLTDTGISEDGYERLFQKNRFRAKRKISLYSNTSLKKVSLTAKPEDVLKLTKIKYAGSSLYVRFVKGAKAGWMKLGQEDTENAYELFYGVASRLAG